MALKHLLLSLLASATLWTPAFSILVTQGSPCASSCGIKGTAPSALICNDDDYSTTPAGDEMVRCLQCESSSTTYITEQDNDLLWFLYNQKYTIETCLYKTNPASYLSPCESACLPLEPVYRTHWWVKGKIQLPIYGYCNDTFSSHVEDCATCMRSKEGTQVIANFLDTMNSACQSQPVAAAGDLVDLPHSNLFGVSDADSTDATTAIATPTGQMSPSDTGQSSTLATSSPIPSQESDTKSSGLSTGATVGVGVGAAVGGMLIAGIIGCIWVRRRRSQRKSQMAATAEVVPEKFPNNPPQELPADAKVMLVSELPTPDTPIAPIDRRI